MIQKAACLCIGLPILFALGCGGPLVPPNHGLGTSSRHGRAAMIKHPNAVNENTEAPEGLSPTTADVVVENYKKNQTTKEQKKRAGDNEIDVRF